MNRTLTGRVDIRGVTSEEDRKLLLGVELRKRLPLGWRMKPPHTFSHSPDGSEIVYRVGIEPVAARSRQ